jgi:hypothetical protein
VQTGRALGPSHDPTLPAISLAKGGLESDCAFVLAPDDEDGKQFPISLETKRCIEADMLHVSILSVRCIPVPNAFSVFRHDVQPEP